MAKRLHPRSPIAQRTAGITLDHAAPLYDWLAPLMTLGSEHRLHRRVVARLALDRPADVLDIGCGTGALTRQVYDALPANAPRRVCGVDAAEAMIAIAQKKAGHRPGLEFAAALAEDLPYSDASFDRALSTFFFHHLNYDLKVKALAEIWRVLRPGGQAAILDVDIPYTRFGALCAWSGYFLFRQPEIAENIHGRLRDALQNSPWHDRWSIPSRHSGYLSLFSLVKPQENTP
ncbi:MAG: class I SAM-dependent methyltransferase [Opitutae bacterium]|nr:class I SAM-dependent methyltransferase [Opitutae bacterium]